MELTKDTSFDDTLNPAELYAWLSLKYVIVNFLGRSSQYRKVVGELMENFHQIGEYMPVKVHFLQSHLDYFSKNFEDCSEEQGSGFTKISVIWRNAIKADWISIFCLITAGAWRGMWSLLSTKSEETIHPWVASLVHYILLATFSKYFVSLCE